MVAPTKHRFNVKEYYRMAETGVLRPDARVELLNGEIIDMSPTGPFHGGVTNYLNEVCAKKNCRPSGCAEIGLWLRCSSVTER